MAKNYGKKFEVKFKEDFSKLPGSTIDRIYDPGFGMKGVKNICDFIGYIFPNIYYLECKSIKGKSFPLINFTQYEKLLAKKDIKGSIAGAVIWFVEKDKVIFVPIETFEALKKDNKKSVSIDLIGNPKYNIIEIPSIKKRIFMDSDYTPLTQLGDK